MSPGGAYFENDLLTSAALKAIKSPHSLRVLLEFYRRRRIRKPTGKHSRWVIVNNGEIVLPYRYAKEKMGIAQTTFSRCLDELVRLGFLDVSEMANGLHKMPTKWAICDRWQRYGQAVFQTVTRQRLKPPALAAAPKGRAFGNGSKKNVVTTSGAQKSGEVTTDGQ